MKDPGLVDTILKFDHLWKKGNQNFVIGSGYYGRIWIQDPACIQRPLTKLLSKAYISRNRTILNLYQTASGAVFKGGGGF